MSGDDTKCKFGNLHLKNAQEVSDYTLKVVKDTEDLITNVIPDKIFFLKKLQEEDFKSGKEINKISSENVLPSAEVCNSVAAKRVKTNDGHAAATDDTTNGALVGFKPVPSNKKVLQLIDVIKPEFKYVIETCEKIKMWISILIPRIEDGNNFGVSVQEEVLNEVHGVQSDSIKSLDTISRYFITRAKLISKIVKYPFLDDYRRAVNEVDENQYLKLEYSLNKMKCDYVLILDIISKNYEKIKKPRSSVGLQSMY